MTGVGTGLHNVAGPVLPMEEHETREQARARHEAKRIKVHTPWGKPKPSSAPVPTPAPPRAPRPDAQLHRGVDAAAIVQDYLEGMTAPAIATARSHTVATVRRVLKNTPGLTLRDDRARRPRTGITPTMVVVDETLDDAVALALAAAVDDLPVTPAPGPVTPETAPVTLAAGGLVDQDDTDAPLLDGTGSGYVFIHHPTPRRLAATTPAQDTLAALTAAHPPIGGTDGHPVTWTVTERPPSDEWTEPAGDVDGARRCTACYDLVATLSSQDECDACVAEREALQRVRPPSVEVAALAYARALKVKLDAQDGIDAAWRVLTEAVRAET